MTEFLNIAGGRTAYDISGPPMLPAACGQLLRRYPGGSS